jgi:nicotinate-nucleotide--dimethylbenzimidazole phosphoribosyltransferase
VTPLDFAPPPPDGIAAAAARARQDRLTKPTGALGGLEDLVVQLAAAQGQALPRSRAAACLIFAADHPVTRHGVSAYPAEVTPAMVANFARGGAAAAVLARRLDVPLVVVDVGVARPVALDAPPAPGVTVTRAAVADHDAGDLVERDAMAPATLAAAVAAGAAAVDALPADTRVVVLGEMGIGNSTCAAAVAAALLGSSAEHVTGAGTGVRGEALARKRAVVAAAAGRVAGAPPARVLAAAGGRDLAALAGAAGRAAERRMAVLVDGFIVSAAMLALVRACPAVRPYLVFAHRSDERGHGRVLEALDARPLLDLGLRLGEASGALAALPLVDAACALHAEMATFDEAAVPDRARA